MTKRVFFPQQKMLDVIITLHLLLFLLISNITFAQQSILEGLTPEQRAQFNQLSPQQRQAILGQLELGNTSGFELPVTQPQTVTPRNTDANNQNSVNQEDSEVLDGPDTQDNSGMQNVAQETETERQRILRKAMRLYSLGIDVQALDPLGELVQLNILTDTGEPVARGETLDNISGDNEFNLSRPPSNTSTGRNESLKPFGYDLFAGVPSTFAPATDIPVPPNYVVGPGDTVVLQLYGQRNVRYELAVSREGVMQFPEVGPLNVSGLSFEEMRNLVEQTVSNTLIGQEVTVSMGALRSIQIFVLGEVYQPGIYTVSSLSTMTNALFSSGGVAELGTLRNIQLLRDGELVTELDLYDLLLNGDTTADARLQPNDVIFIPTIGRTVSISGEVRRSGVFELDEEDTIGDVIALTGGLKPTGFPLLAHVERINQLGQREILDINLSDSAGLNSVVNDGDSLHVDSILGQIESGVNIAGHVYRPGVFAWREDLRISDLIDVNDLMPSPDLDYALLIRELLPTRNIEVYQINLGEALLTPGSPEDRVLQRRDRLLVFGENSLENRLDRRLLIHPLIQTLRYQSTQNNFRKVVGVSGAVSSPGDYPLIENMTIEHLLLAAGGATENADLNQAELSRRIINSVEEGVVSENIRLNLTDALTLNSIVRPLDRLTVRQLPNWGELETVTIDGEVRSPGTYIIGKDDTLGDLINRAGGLTQYADAKAGIFLRDELRRNEQVLLDDFNRRLTRNLLNASLTSTSGQLSENRVNVEVMNELLAQIEEAEPTGRLIIDLPAILSNSPNADVILRDGDQLMIPRTRQDVSVIGEVQLPTSHLFNEGLSVEEYISRSGGFNSNADENNIFVIKSNGQVIPYSNSVQSWFSFNNNQFALEAGDSIVIPYEADLRDPLITWMNVSTVLFNLATTVLAIESVGN